MHQPDEPTKKGACFHTCGTSNFFVPDFFAVDGSEILHPGMSEDHHEDDRFALLNPDPFLQFGRHVKCQCSETHQAAAKAERVNHQLQVASVKTAV